MNKYGFFGVGNMASAIIKGMLKNGVTMPDNIFFFDINDEMKKKAMDNFKINCVSSGEDLIKKSDFIFFAIKPQYMAQSLDDNAEYFKNDSSKANKVLVSVVASFPIEKFENKLGKNQKIIRTMPNVNAEVLESMTALCRNKNVTDKEYDTIKKLFNAIGNTVDMEEKLFPEFAAIAASSPAFTYLYIEAIADAALKAGINKQVALKIVAQSVLGSSKMLLESSEHPGALQDKVCSPGGTTIAGMAKLSELGFHNSIVKAIDAVMEKDRLNAKKD